jgi:hypothetical protein
VPKKTKPAIDQDTIDALKKIQVSKPISTSSQPNTMTIQCTFYPQAWHNDYAIAVDPEGSVTWTTNWPDHKPLPSDNDYESDQLARESDAPLWIQNWSGPFYVEVIQIQTATQ